jgi:hypothetical protein
MVDRSITSSEVVDLLEWLFLVYGRPQHIRSDNGPELVAKKVQNWLAEQGCQTIYISPGSPWENAYIESFIGNFRKECADRYLFYTLKETRNIVESWRQEYNYYRPHSSLGYLPPSAFAAQQPQPPLIVGGTEIGVQVSVSRVSYTGVEMSLVSIISINSMQTAH